MQPDDVMLSLLGALARAPVVLFKRAVYRAWGSLVWLLTFPDVALSVFLLSYLVGSGRLALSLPMGALLLACFACGVRR